MPFGLAIQTDRAHILQDAIKSELFRRGYSTDEDDVMAEYIIMMVINNKGPSQITTELQDVIGSDFDSSFTDWLFKEAESGAEEPAPVQVESLPQADAVIVPQPIPTAEPSRRNTAPRNGIYQQALSQALPASSASNKRSSSARSPSPTHPNKIRRTDLPTGPRAMQRDGSGSNTRSLLERVGGPPGRHTNGYPQDDIQNRIDNIVNVPNEQNMMMQSPGFPGMPVGPMDVNAMGNPMMLQELMMNQMAIMAQLSGMNQYAGNFTMQNMMPGDMAMYPGGMNGFNNTVPNGQMNGRGRANSRGRGRGRGLNHSSSRIDDDEAPAQVVEVPSAQTALPTILAPTPFTPEAIAAAQQRPGYVLPERPQSPTLCKYSIKCTNAQCRFSHPSPVATSESGVVLSNDPCEKGKDCKDKDCIKAHVSPAVLKPQAEQPVPSPSVAHHPPPTTAVPCRFGAGCTRPNCAFSHPTRHPTSNTSFAQPCRFGVACTRATCHFQHPEGRVLPTSFHRGLSTTAPLVNVRTPETGSMGGASLNKSVKFNNTDVKDKLKALEEKKSLAEKAVKEAEAASGKKAAVPISV